MNTPKEETKEQFLNHLLSIKTYWQNENPSMSLSDRLDGIIHSILVTIDGGSSFPPIGMIINPNSEENTPIQIFNEKTCLHSEWNSLVKKTKAINNFFRRIKFAAVKGDNGEIFYGKDYPEIFTSYSIPDCKQETYKMGFLDGNMTFISKEEAYVIALEARQTLLQKNKNSLSPEDIYANGGWGYDEKNGYVKFINCQGCQHI